tara:strand:- start:1817 stop:2656 length:840 start_codon:yes stop_codon:yes gene_type:complete
MKSRSKKNNSLFNKLLNNKIVLYVVALIALIDIIAYIINKEFGAVVFFYLAGLIAYKFSSNMTIILGSALIATSLVHLLKNMFGFIEGFKEGAKHSKTEDKNSKTVEDEVVEDEVVEDEEMDIQREMEREMEIQREMEIEDAARPKKIPDVKAENMNNKHTLKGNGRVAGMQPSKKKSPFTNQKLNPQVINNIPNKDKLTQNMKKVDNIEAAYDNLEKTIGENGIRSMSGATKDLIAQQNQLVKGLKEVTPVLNEAMGALSKIDLSSLSGIFNKFGSQV